MKELKFYLITDPHYFATELGCSGPEYEDFMHYEQKCFAETESICNSVFDYLKTADEADILLIAGDLSFNGEKKSHEGFLKLLYELRESGKKIYVVTADHDFKNKEGETFAFGEKGRYSPEHTKRQELFNMYRDFGFGEAIAADEEHLSYVAQLNEDVRLFGLNADFKKDGQYYFDENQLSWIKEQAEKGRKDNQTMIAMLHYPVLPGVPLFSVIKPATVYDCYGFADFLADEGIHLIFTGHMHNQSINLRCSEKGNKLYDVCTGAIIADPAYIRHITLTEGKAVIKSIPTPDFQWETDDCKKYLKDMFDRMIVNVLTDMRDDTPRVMRKLHIKEKKSTVRMLRLAGKIICSVKVGTLTRLLFVKCDKSVKKMRVLDFATELVRGAFEGNPQFRQGTPKGDALLALLKRLRPILRKIDLKDKQGNSLDIIEVLKHSAGNYDIDDYNAVLEW